MYTVHVYMYILSSFISFPFSSSDGNDTPPPPAAVDPSVVVQGQQRRRTREPSLVWALLRSYGFIMFVAAFFKLGNDLLAFVSPQLLK